MTKRIIFQQDYSSESIIDYEEDILYALEHHVPEDMDEHGFYPGTLRLTLEYITDDE